MLVHFLLIAEGSSDEALIPHLESLCIDQGASEVTGTALDFGRLHHRVGHTVAAKVGAAVQLEPNANIIFIHRDADRRDPQPRYEEIAAAVASQEVHGEHVAVVPVQQTEAWLLLDEHSIRKAAYRPHGNSAVHLPSPQHVERTARPKEVLQAALAAASELTGRRLEHFKRDFAAQRRLLLQQLPIGGALENLNSWCRLRRDTGAAIARLTQFHR